MTQAKFPFTDFHGYKDYVTFVRMCAPDNFPLRDGLSSSDQWTLQLAFEGLHQGLTLAREVGVSDAIIAQCQQHFESAYVLYVGGDRKAGFKAIQAAQLIISRAKKA